MGERVGHEMSKGGDGNLLQFPLRRVIGADVEGLAVGFGVGVVTLDLEKMAPSFQN